MKAAITGMGIIAPGVVGVAALREALRAPPPVDFKVQSMGDEGNVRTRRLPRLDRMTLAVAHQALANRGTGELAVVFGTGYGGLSATVDFLEGVATRGDAFGSPTAFHQSVHHAPLGQLSIALGIHGACLTTSARELSGESALRMGVDLLAAGRAEQVLVVAADEVVPTLEHAHAAFGGQLRAGEGAAAVLLSSSATSDLWLEAVALTAHPGPSLRFTEDPERLSPLLARLREAAGPAPLLSRAGWGGSFDDAERAALERNFHGAEHITDSARFGFNPSGGLLRLVAAAVRLREARKAGAALIHGASLGGGQAATVMRHQAEVREEPS